MVNLLLIGFGPHARKCFYPALEKYGVAWGFRIPCAVDLEQSKPAVLQYLSDRSQRVEMCFLRGRDSNHDLNLDTRAKLNDLVKRHDVSGVIVATEPTSHIQYSKWAIESSLSVLLDKPVSTRSDASTSVGQTHGILEDYKKLVGMYQVAKKKNSRLLFSVLSQRRYHGGILKVKELLQEVFRQTNCPITAIQANHSDGQWRTPDEMVDIDYHGFNRGFGKCSHSGYHFFDTTSYLVECVEKKSSKIDSVDVVSTFVRPGDLISQFHYRDYPKLFPNFSEHNYYSERDFLMRTRRFGETDAFISLSFKSGSMVVTLGSVNLLHNSFSQRGWISSAGRELYKGNGRVGHESYQINQGPFQTIYYHAFKGVDSADFEIGGEYHIDIHVFRNSQMFPAWETYKRFGGRDLGLDFPQGDFSGAQEGARRKCIKEFVDFLRRKMTRNQLQSELPSHQGAVSLMSAAYKSAARRFCGRSPLVNVSF